METSFPLQQAGDWVFASGRHRGRTPIWGQAILRKYIRPSRSAPEFRSNSDGTRSGIRTRLSCGVWEQNSKSCRNCCGIRLCDPHWMCTHRRSRQPNMQLRQPSCRWCFRARQVERHNRRDQVTLPREGKSTVRKGTLKRARKRALLGPQWFRKNSPNSFGMNGGDDETRTRDLCRDS